MIAFPRLLLVIHAMCAVCLAAKSDTSRKLRRSVQSDEVRSGESDAAANMAQLAPVVTDASSSEIKLISSMEALQQSEEQGEDPESPKAQVQKKLVALIWLERTYQLNLDSMSEAAYTAKITEGKAGLEKDTSPAMATMLSKMRAEMHQFAVPFYQDVVKDELKRIRERQKLLLDKEIALDAKGDNSNNDDDAASLTEESSAAAKRQKAKKQKDPEAEEAEKQQRRSQSNVFVWIMTCVMGGLILLVVGIACVVRNRPRSTD